MTTRRQPTIGRRALLEGACAAGLACTSTRRRAATAPAEPPDFWARPRAGANFFHHRPRRELFDAAAEFGLQFVRLGPNLWPTDRRDFLIGDADGYAGMESKELDLLNSVLDDANRAGLCVVLMTVSLPGSRWRQQNDDTDDLRLWTDPAFADQAARFWTDLARAVGDHPALAGLNILNEPHPERVTTQDDLAGPALHAWHRKVRGTGLDLNAFNRRLVTAIRDAGCALPIVLDAGSYASPQAFAYLEPLEDPDILYALHVYEPYAYTNLQRNGGALRYPGPMPDIDAHHPIDRTWLQRHVDPVLAWQARHAIPSSRILVGEFGCNRRAPGIEHYFHDLLAIFEAHRWHWAFWSFREDGWPGMDYEVGTAPLPATFWTALDRGEHPIPPRSPNALSDLLRTAAQRRTRA